MKKNKLYCIICLYWGEDMKLKFRAEAKDVVIFIIFCIVLLYFIATLRNLGFINATCKLIFYYSWPFSNSEIGVLTLPTVKNLYNLYVVLYIHSSSVFTSQLPFIDSANLRSCNTVVFTVKKSLSPPLQCIAVMFMGHLYFYRCDILHVWYFKK